VVEGEMAGRPSITEAVGLLERELRAGHQDSDDLDVGEAWRAFVHVGRRLFDVQAAPDADGLLFQYGTYSFDGPPVFTVDFARQFEVSDAQGDHDHYLQVHCELRCGSGSLGAAFGSFNSWFFHGDGADLDAWVRDLTEHPAWMAVRTLRPTEVRVFEERI
jgi:hypothetical protein